MSRFLSWLGVPLGIAIFVLCLWLTDIPSWETLASFDLFWVAMAVLAQGGLAITTPWRWLLVARGAGITLPYLQSCRITAYASLAAAVVPQTVADLAGRGPWAARHSGCNLLNATNTVLCDRLLDVYLLCLLVVPGILFCQNVYEPGICLWMAVASLILGFVVLLVLGTRFFAVCNWCLRLVAALCNAIPFLRGRFSKTIAPIILSRKEFVWAWAVTVFKYAMITLFTLAFFREVHIEVSWTLVAMVLPLTQLVVIFAFTPGGLGIFELGWLGVLSWYGVNDAQIGLFLVSQRLCNTFIVTVWAGIALCLPKRLTQKESVHG